MEVHCCVAVNGVVPLQTAVAPPVLQEQESEGVVDVPVTTELGLVQATSGAIHIMYTVLVFIIDRLLCLREIITLNQR